MKKIYILAAMLFSLIAVAQDPEIKTDMPVIMGPSPTVASLMKFEEVPVNNYSGIPNISIPLFSNKTYSKDVNLNISLDYHISNAAANKRSSDVGTGWTLIAGGTISRTVRGLPDEYWKGIGNNSKRGIYQDSLASGVHNNFYEAFDILTDTIGANLYDNNEFLWNAQVRGMFDTEHDLWQFNFMGFTGRFYIKKNASGVLEAIPLDDYRLKIVNHYNTSPTTTTNTKYTPESFDVYDDKGNRYVFDVIENTTARSTTTTIGIMQFGDPGTIHPSTTTKYISAFHLSKVYDTQGNKLLEFFYNPAVITEAESNISVTKTYESNPQGGDLEYYTNPEHGCANKININPPAGTLSVTSSTSTHVKKLLRIDVNGFAKIAFTFEEGRQDFDLVHADSAYAFKGIIVRDWHENNIKKVDLEQSVNLGNGKMSFGKVNFGNFENSKVESYIIDYYGYDGEAPLSHWDEWGYNATPENELLTESSYQSYNAIGLIKKMTLPTGGCILYKFEPNTYSFIGSEAVTDFAGNPGNWLHPSYPYNFVAFGGGAATLFTIGSSQNVTFRTNVDTGDSDPVVNDWKFTVKNASTGATVATLKKDPTIFFVEEDPCADGDCIVGANLSAGTYTVTFTSGDQSTFDDNWSAGITASYTTFVPTGEIRNYLLGAGNRIKHISWFETSDFDEDEYLLYGTGTPLKVKNYEYNLFDNPAKSSGSLICKPKFSYMMSKRECYWCGETSGNIEMPEITLNYDVSTEFSNLMALRTQGADIGYRNVKVYETGNGHTEYTYTSPFEEPVEINEYNLRPPFIPLVNKDYRRGLLKKEVTFNQSGDMLRQVEMDYAFDEHTITTGFRLYYPEEFVRGTYAPMLYSLYMGYIDGCDQTCFCYFGQPYEFIHWQFIDEAYGWAKLTSKTTREYFYGGNANLVRTHEEFDYNPANKQVAWHTKTASEGETLKTEFFYHTGNSDNPDISQNRISEIEEIKTYRNSALLSRNKIVYTNAFGSNHPWRPSVIQAAKGSGTLEDKIYFSKYDDFGNLLEVKQAGGTPISYIWGYNNTQAVAKIENLPHNSIPTGIIANIKTHSDAYNTGLLLNELKTLRLNSALATAMVTGYTFDPLVGISTMVDPKGIRTYYEYDEFGRLKIVRDNQESKLTENQYHYRTQE